MKTKKQLMIILPLIAISMTLVSALLVPYISNLYSQEISVKLPVEVSETEPITAFANEDVTFDITFDNLKDSNVRGTIEYYITNSEGLSCNDFNLISLAVDGNPNPENYIEVGRCYDDEPNRIRLSSITAPSTAPTGWVVTNWDAGQSHTTEVTLNFKNVIGDYNFESQVMYD